MNLPGWAVREDKTRPPPRANAVPGRNGEDEMDEKQIRALMDGVGSAIKMAAWNRFVIHNMFQQMHHQRKLSHEELTALAMAAFAEARRFVTDAGLMMDLDEYIRVGLPVELERYRAGVGN